MDNLNDILYFTKVVERQSFTAAARDLSLTPAVVSKRVSLLEEKLGVELLKRTTRRLVLTDIGQDFFARCGQAIAEIDAACNAAADGDYALRGSLKVRASLGVGQILVAPAIRKFAQQYPDISVDISIIEPPSVTLEQGYDILLIDQARPKDPNYHFRHLGDVQYLICASPAYIKAAGRPKSPHDLSRFNCIINESQKNAAEWRFNQGRTELRVRVQGSYRTNNGLAMHDAVLGGLGVGRLPDYAIADDLRNGRLIVLFDNVIGWGKTITAAVPHREHQAGRLVAFLDFLETYIADWTATKPRKRTA